MPSQPRPHHALDVLVCRAATEPAVAIRIRACRERRKPLWQAMNQNCSEKRPTGHFRAFSIGYQVRIWRILSRDAR
jgi:hypothetical protein